MWTSLFIITIAAVLANTSRMAQLVALLLLVAICVQFGPMLLPKVSGGKSIALAGALAIALAFVAFAQASHFEQALNRWQLESQQIPTDARWQASRVAVLRCRTPDCSALGQGRFALCFQRTIALGATRFPVRGDFCTRIICRPCWNGAGWENSLGVALLRRNHSRYSQLQRARQAGLDAAETRAAAVSYHSTHRSGAARAGRFPVQIESIQLYVATYLGFCWGSMLWRDHGLRTTERADRSTSWHSAT